MKKVDLPTELVGQADKIKEYIKEMRDLLWVSYRQFQMLNIKL